jgi:peptidoglycan lytic transglycosylase
MTGAGTGRLALVLAGLTFLTACADGKTFKLFDKPLFAGKTAATPSTATAASTGATIEQDVEAPDVFQKTDDGLWDGRPSLGGVWIAHPSVTDPERVIIRNEDNGKFIIGALFRRERENPGPRFQVSSDAAAELGMLAGSPVKLSVTALRREAVPVAPEVSAPPVDTLESTDAIQATPLDPVTEMAASAIEAATADSGGAQAGTPAVRPVARPSTKPPTKPAPAPQTRVSSLEKPFIQIGIYSVEANAKNTAKLLRNSGVLPTITTSQSGGKTYWRVIVGPTGSKAERSIVIKKVRGLGFTDAYPVTN